MQHCTHGIPNLLPDSNPDSVPDRITDRVPDHVSDHVPDQVPDHVSDHVPDHVSDSESDTSLHARYLPCPLGRLPTLRTQRILKHRQCRFMCQVPDRKIHDHGRRVGLL